MSLFAKTSEWLNRREFKRVQICHRIGNKDIAVKLSVQPNLFTDFDNLFFLDINRNLSAEICEQLNNNKIIQSFVFQPASVQDLLSALSEIRNFSSLEYNKDLKITLVLNDWESIFYLFQNAYSGSNIFDLLMQLKFLSDYLDVILISGSENSSREILKDWSNLSLRILDQNNMQVEKSSFPIWQNGQNISFFEILNMSVSEINSEIKLEKKAEQENIINNSDEIKTANQVFLPIEEIQEIYDSIVNKLASSRNKEELLTIRKEIQILGSNLSMEQKNSLSNIYKVNLERIKMLEKNNNLIESR